MATNEYKRALEAARREYEDLLDQRESLDTRIARLAQSIGSLMRLCGYAPTAPWGLTEACRMVLKSAEYPLTPVEIRDQLEAMGIEISCYTNNLAVIHTTLKRLTKAGEASYMPRGYDEPGYQWERARLHSANRKGASGASKGGKRGNMRREK